MNRYVKYLVAGGLGVGTLASVEAGVLMIVAGVVLAFYGVAP
jgi:hypothetical protein